MAILKRTRCLIFVFVLLLSSVSSYGEKLTIDSLRLTLRDVIPIVTTKGRSTYYVAGEHSFHCIEITATIENTSTFAMACVIRYGSANYSFQYDGVNYAQSLFWRKPAYQHMRLPILTIAPGEAKQVQLLAFMPLSNKETERWEKESVEEMYFLLGWRWKKKKLAEADYLKWFKRILPTMKIFVDCVVEDFKETRRITASIDPEKVPVSTDFEFRGSSGLRDSLSKSTQERQIEFVTVVP